MPLTGVGQWPSQYFPENTQNFLEILMEMAGTTLNKGAYFYG
jgi:hypothetical protein